MSLPKAQAAPRKTEVVSFDYCGYPGFKGVVWVSAPLRLADEIFTTQEEMVAREVLLKLYPEWNFVDEEGNDIEHTLEGMNNLPSELVTQMLLQFRYATTGLRPDTKSDEKPEILSQNFKEAS